MVEALAQLEAGTLRLAPQAAGWRDLCRARSTRPRRASTGDSRRRQVHDHIRALSPFPGAWCEMAIAGKTERLKVLRSVVVDGAGAPGTLLDEELTVACGDGAVRLVEVQRAGGKPLTAPEFLRGAKLARGAHCDRPDAASAECR